METLINIGIISSVAVRWPLSVQDAWLERIVELRQFMRAQTAEAQEFASSYD